MNRKERTLGARGAVLAAAVVSAIGVVRPAGATTYTWTSMSDGVWSLSGNWSGGAPPVNGNATTDISFFTSSTVFPKNVAVTVTATDDQTGSGTAGTFSLYSLDLEGDEQNGSGRASVSIDGATLNFANGVSGNAQVNLDATASGGPMNYTVANNVTLTNDTAFKGAGGAGFTFSGAIGGPGALNKTGASTLVLSGSNTFTGGTSVGAGGQITIANTNALQNSTLNYVSTGGAVSFDGQTAVTLGGLTGEKNLALTNATNQAVALTVGNNGSFGIYSGVLSSNGSLTKTGTGTLTLSGSNTYTGPTTINGGTLSVSSLANGGSASGVGQSSNAAGNLVIDGGTLQYTGNGASTNRRITIGASGGTIDASGTGAVNFTSTSSPSFAGTAASRTLTFTGTNAGNNTFAAPITNNGSEPTGVTKSGSGTWVLTGNNTYTGNTNILGGTLSVVGSGTVNTSAVVNLNGGSLSLSAGAGTLTRGTGQTLMGQGTITGAANLNGAVQVGQTHNNAGGTASTLTVTGNTIFGSTAALTLDLFSTTTADKFVTNGALTFGGTLNVARPTSFTFAAGQSWDLFDFTSSSGAFGANQINLPALGSGLTWNTSQLYTTGVISIDSTFTAAHFALSLTPTSSRVMSGGTTTVTSKITSTGTGTADSINYSNLHATDATATITGTAGSGTALAQGASGTAGQTFSSTVTGVHTVTPGVSATNANLGTAVMPDSTSPATVTVVDNRTVTASSVDLGRVMVGQNASGSSTLSTTGDDDHYTRVTVNDGGPDANGISATGTSTQFDSASSTATRNLGGTFTSSGSKSGSVDLQVTGEGLMGETINPVSILYTGTAVQQRVVTATSVDFGKVISGTAVGARTSNLTTTGSDNDRTRVTVAGTSDTQDGLTATGTSTLFNGASSTGSRSVSGTLTGVGDKTGSLSLGVTGEGLAGEGAYSAVQIGYAATVVDHSVIGATLDATANPPHTTYPDGMGNPHSATLDASGGVVTQDNPDGDATINVHFGVIYADPSSHAWYPVEAYFDVTSASGFFSDLDFLRISSAYGVNNPNGVANWTLTEVTTGALSAGGVKEFKLTFDVADYATYLPHDFFTSSWDLNFGESATGGIARTVHVNADAVAVPTPISAFAGAGLLGGLGIGRLARSRRSRNGQPV